MKDVRPTYDIAQILSVAASAGLLMRTLFVQVSAEVYSHPCLWVTLVALVTDVFSTWTLDKCPSLTRALSEVCGVYDRAG